MSLDGLSDRQNSILKIIINEYIATGEPVGSRAISKNSDLGLSSATIRNEMSDLEGWGYLEQPYTSAGRVPSDKGYRLYVDKLMQVITPTIDELTSIRAAMENQINEMGELIRLSSQIMSEITGYVGISSMPGTRKIRIKTVQVVPIEPAKVLIVVVTNADIVKNTMVKLPRQLMPETVVDMSAILSDQLKGFSVEQINLQVINDIQQIILSMGISDDILISLLNGVAECVNKIDQSEVYLDGATNILDYPEFENISKAKEIFNLLNAKDTLLKILCDQICDEGINIQIGAENKIDEIKGCSLITTTYKLEGATIGIIGLIGPTRMNYSKVTALIEYIRKQIDGEINKLVWE